jgi:hypothetical protein
VVAIQRICTLFGQLTVFHVQFPRIVTLPRMCGLPVSFVLNSIEEIKRLLVNRTQALFSAQRDRILLHNAAFLSPLSTMTIVEHGSRG